MSIMDEEAVFVVAWYSFTELLNRPVGGWIRRRVAMKYAAGADLHHDEYVNSTEAGSHRNHKITGDKSSGMDADKCAPALRTPA